MILYGLILLFPTIKNVTSIILEVTLPFLIGFFIAYLLAPLICKLSNRLNRKLAVFLVVILFVIVVGSLFLMFIPNLIKEVNQLIEIIPDILIKSEIFIEQILEKLHLNMIDSKQILEKAEEFLYGRMSEVTSVLLSIAQVTVKLLFSSVLSFVTAVYFLLDFENIKSYIKNKLVSNNHTILYDFLVDLNNLLRSYFRGVFLVAIFLSIVSSIFLLILKVPFAAILGIMIGITNIIPYVGPYIGGGFAVALGLSVSFKKGIIVLIGIIVIQAIESMLITPNVQGKSVNVHPVLVLFFIILFGNLFGILGMIIAIPVLAFLQSLLKTLKIIENNGKS